MYLPMSLMGTALAVKVEPLGSKSTMLLRRAVM